MSALEIPQSFFGYWSFRYAMAMELYIVEKWEKITIHVLMGVLFLLFAYISFTLAQYLPMLLPKFTSDDALHQVTTATVDVNNLFQSGITS